MELLAQYDSDLWTACGAWGTWASAVATFLAVMWAIFGEEFRSYFNRPIATVVCDNKGHFFQSRIDPNATPNSAEYSIRVAVYNVGKRSAFDVECLMTELCEWNGQKWVARRNFVPRPLRWNIDHKSVISHIPPRTYRLLNIGDYSGFIAAPREGRVILHFASQSELAYENLEAGRYQAELVISSKDQLLYRGYIEFEWPGEEMMLFSPECFQIRTGNLIEGAVHS